MTVQPARRRGRGRLRPVLVVVAVLCGLGLAAGLAPAAYAHASLVSTDPAEGAVLAQAPDEVTLRFSEPVTLGEGSIRLYDAAGTEVASEAASVDDTVTATPGEELGRGTFVLTYRVVSADGHPVAGSLSFSVGAPSETVVPPPSTAGSSPAVTAVHGAVQAVTYLGLLLAAGLVVFLVWLLPDAAALAGVRARLARLTRRSAALAVVGAVLLVPVGAVYQQGSGLAGLATLAAWAGLHDVEALQLMLVVFGLGIVAGTMTPGPPDHSGRLVLSGGAVAALAGLAAVGHTRSYGPTALVMVTDVVHVTAAAVWFGGLVGLVVALPAMAGRERLAAQTLARFSTLAGGLLVAVAAAGVLLGWHFVGSWAALLGTAYGVILLVKVGLVGAVAATAAWNRYRLLPAVLAAQAHQTRVSAAGRLRNAVRLEAAGLVVVLVLTGYLVNQVPQERRTTPDAAAGSDIVSAVADDVRVVAHLDPGRVGPNVVTVQVQDLDGEPVEPWATPVVSLSGDGVDLGSRPVRNVDSGTYRARVVIPTAGEWEVQVSVRTGEFTNPVLTLEPTVDQ